MNLRDFQKIRVRDYRCFHKEQTARIAPLTLLVGNNSTGKTSFLAAVRAIWEVAYRSAEPDFRALPYDLGPFSEIVYNPNNSGTRATSFGIGFSGIWQTHFTTNSSVESSLDKTNQIEFDVTFESRAAAPYPAKISLRGDDIWIRILRSKSSQIIVEFGLNNGAWRLNEVGESLGTKWFYFPLFYFGIREKLYDHDKFRKTLKNLADNHSLPSDEDIDKLNVFLDELPFMRHIIEGEPFASAPIRSRPSRTYDPIKPSRDPEGAYVPTYLANLQYGHNQQWRKLKKKLKKFGRESGLFHTIGVKQYGDTEGGGPFQLEIKLKNGGDRNLIDVGYGVSQVLPVLAELFHQDSPPMFLFQQPEVHLHPSAQAALGSLFCETAASGNQLIVETHSDYIVDRILLDIRDKRTNLSADEVSILYFENEGKNVSIHSIRIDEKGEVLDSPEGYRRFFKDELKRVIEY